MNHVITRIPEISLEPFGFAKADPFANWFSDEKRGFDSDEERDWLPKMKLPTLPAVVSKPVFFEIRVNQNDSVANSIDQYLARLLTEKGEKYILAIYRQKIGDALSFYTVTVDDEDETIDSLLEQERVIYSRFPELDVEFHILPGKESEDLLPTGSVLIVKQS